ncbi:MAG: hypothetical protein NXH70_02030 [Hyphomonas sp.]|nr:hypothetical protein [Hyphomonas sp.]
MRAENAFDNAIDALHLIYGYAVLCNDENLRLFANAVICGNDAKASAEFWLKDLPCVLDKLEAPKPKKSKRKPQDKSICISTPKMVKRRQR